MAASSNAIRAGAAFVELFIRDNLTAPLDKIGKRLAAWGSSLVTIGSRIFAAGSAASGALVAMSTSFAVTGSELERIAATIGISVESLSELRYAAEQSGMSFEELQNAFKGIDNFLGQLRSGSAEAVQTLGQLGLSVADLQGKNPEQVFEILGDAISEIQDPTLRAALAMKTLGEAGLKALPMFREGAASLNRLREEARALGIQVSSQDARAATLLGQAWGRVLAILSAGIFAIGAGLAPVLTRAANIITGLIAGVVRWIQNNRALVQTIFAITVGVMAAGAAIVALGGILVIVGLAASGLAAAIGAVLSVMTFLLSPVGLVIAAVGTLAYALRNQLAGVFSPLTNALSVWIGEMRRSLSAALAFLAAGDFESAFRVVATESQNIWDQVAEFLQTTWDQGLDYLRETWNSWTDFFQDTWDTAVNAVLAVWSTFKTRYHSQIEVATIAWDGFCAGMFGSFQEAIAGMLVALDVLQAALQTATAGMSTLFGSGNQSSIVNLASNVVGGAVGTLGMATNEATGFGTDVIASFETNQNNTANERESERQVRLGQLTRDRNARDIGREFDRMVRDELLRMERQRQRVESEWTEALTPGQQPATTLAGAGANLNTAVRAAQPLGTFNAFAVGGMFASDRYARETAANTAQVAEQTRQINARLQAVLEYS